MTDTAALIHIGYHKTASTWLQNRIFTDTTLGFALHPDRSAPIYEIVAVNPLSYDAQSINKAFGEFIATATSEGHVPVISHERLSGHPLYNGYDARDIADRLAASFGGSRILVVLRRQVDMMLSLYKHWVRVGGTERIDELWKQRTSRGLRRPGPGLETFEYHHLIAYYQELFGKDRVLVLPYERIREDAAAFVGDITAFVGRPRPGSVPTTVENASRSAGGLAVTRYLNHVTRAVGVTGSVGSLEDNPPNRGRLRTIRRIDALVPTAASKRVERRWLEAVAQIGTERFAESNRATAELTGLDLARWGYPLP